MPGVTKEQIQEAREADLFRYLQFHEPGVLKRDGPNYRHKEHDSLVYVTGKGYWYWNSRGRSINALDYLVEVRGYGLVDAVNTLTDGRGRQTEIRRSALAKSPVQREPEKRPFSLPWAKRCATFAVSYLQRRGISSRIISRCFRLGLLYEARHRDEAVCVFVGKDDGGKARFACMRGIGTSLKKDVAGSDKKFSFCYPPDSPGSRQLAVFEAPIDALSHAALQELEGWKWNGWRLSLGGTSHVALTAFLERHLEIRRVTLYMKIKLIDFGAEKIRLPYQPHGNDAGAYVYMPYGCTLKPGDVEKVPLGFGIEVPDGYAGYVFPRSSMAAKGLVCELLPCGFRLPWGDPRDYQ